MSLRSQLVWSSIRRRFTNAEALTHILLLCYSLNLFLGFTFLVDSLKIVYYVAFRERVVNIIFYSQTVDRSVWLLTLSATLFILILLKLYRHDQFPRSIIFIQSIYLLAVGSELVGHENLGLTVAILTSMATLIGVLAYAERLLAMPRRTASALFLVYFLLPLIAIETCSAIAEIMNFIHPADWIQSDSVWLLPPVETNSLIHLETQISSAAYPATPYLIVLLVFSWALVPLVGKLRIRIARSKRFGGSGPRNSSMEAEPSTWRRAELSRTKTILIVGCAITIGGLLVLAPYISQSKFVGVDTQNYYTPLSKMTDYEAALKIILQDDFAGPRALYFLLLYLIKALTGLSAMAVVKIAVAVPLSLISISTYLLVRYGAKNDSLAALSSLLAVLSFNTTIGMYAGTYGNWLALSIMMLSFALLIKASSENSRKILLGSILTSSMVLLAHAWSWMVFMAVLATYSVISILAHRVWKDAEARRGFLFSLSILLANGAFASLLLLFLRNLPATLVVLRFIPALGADSLLKFPAILSVTLNDYVGGFLADPLMYFLAAIGALQGGYKRSFERLLYSWLMPTSMLILLTEPSYHWRILYMMPIQILATLGILQLIRRVDLLLPNQEINGRPMISRMLKASLLCLMILSLFNYAARSINLLFLFFIH